MIISTLKRCLIRSLNPGDHNPRRITKSEKDFEKRLNFKDIEFPVKIRDLHKIKKQKRIPLAYFWL